MLDNQFLYHNLLKIINNKLLYHIWRYNKIW